MNPLKLQRIRRLLWLYFWLLIFEGALRKWVLPGLSNPLLLVRDPIALLALWLGWPLLRQPPWIQWLQPLLAIGFLAFPLAITVGHGDIPTAAYGARILVLQLPLIFLYGAVFDRNSVIRFVWALAWLSIPMTLLIVTQSNLPSTHFLNVAPGGEGTAVFSGALDRFRPPGVFSFISGLSAFFTLVAGSLFSLVYGTPLRQKAQLFCFAVGICLIVALPVSISRSLLAGYLQVLLATIIALVLSRNRLTSLISGLIAILLAIGIGTSIPAFQASSDAFQARWEIAAAAEMGEDERVGGATGVFQTRVLGGFTAPFVNIGSVPFFGQGIGIGTNVGSQRLSGELVFLVGEGAWEANLFELGLLLGIPFLIWRVALSFWFLRLSIRSAVLGNPIPLILLGSSFLMVISGQLSQPTNLGFLVVAAGLTLASTNNTSSFQRSVTSYPRVTIQAT